jgi:hypothetical protein
MGGGGSRPTSASAFASPCLGKRAAWFVAWRAADVRQPQWGWRARAGEPSGGAMGRPPGSRPASSPTGRGRAGRRRLRIGCPGCAERPRGPRLHGVFHAFCIRNAPRHSSAMARVGSSPCELIPPWPTPCRLAPPAPSPPRPPLTRVCHRLRPLHVERDADFVVEVGVLAAAQLLDPAVGQEHVVGAPVDAGDAALVAGGELACRGLWRGLVGCIVP